jgi:hypothetical protein
VGQVSRRTKAELAEDEAAEAEFHRLHAGAAADRVRACPETRYTARYLALAAEGEKVVAPAREG